MAIQDATPTRKVGWGLFANAMIGVGAWGLSEFSGVTIPSDVQAYLHTGVVFMVQWWVTDSER